MTQLEVRGGWKGGLLEVSGGRVQSDDILQMFLRGVSPFWPFKPVPSLFWCAFSWPLLPPPNGPAGSSPTRPDRSWPASLIFLFLIQLLHLNKMSKNLIGFLKLRNSRCQSKLNFPVCVFCMKGESLNAPLLTAVRRSARRFCLAANLFRSVVLDLWLSAGVVAYLTTRQTSSRTEWERDTVLKADFRNLWEVVLWSQVSLPYVLAWRACVCEVFERPAATPPALWLTASPSLLIPSVCQPHLCSAWRKLDV